MTTRTIDEQLVASLRDARALERMALALRSHFDDAVRASLEAVGAAATS